MQPTNIKMMDTCRVIAVSLNEYGNIKLHGLVEETIIHIQKMLRDEYEIVSQRREMVGLIPVSNMKGVYNDDEELIGVDIVPQTIQVIGYSLHAPKMRRVNVRTYQKDIQCLKL